MHAKTQSLHSEGQVVIAGGLDSWFCPQIPPTDANVLANPRLILKRRPFLRENANL